MEDRFSMEELKMKKLFVFCFLPWLLMTLAAALLWACTPQQKAIARTADDVAKVACQDSLRAEAEKQGLSVEDLCNAHDVLQPFIDALLSAKKQGSAKAGLTKSEPEVKPGDGG